MDAVTLAPFRPPVPVVAEVVPARSAPARVELKVEIVASQPPPAPAAEPAPAPVALAALPAPRAEWPPPTAAVDLPVQRARVIAAYARPSVFEYRVGAVLDVRG